MFVHRVSQLFAHAAVGYAVNVRLSLSQEQEFSDVVRKLFTTSNLAAMSVN